MRLLGFFIGCTSLAWAGSLMAAEPTGVEFFEQKIRPVLVKHCYSCHSEEAKKTKGGLRLDNKAVLLKGGDSGAVIVPGKANESLLIQALRHDGIAMPPKEKLPEEIVADFERWVRMGAPDPRDGKAVVAQTTIDMEAGRKFWSFQPVRTPVLPEVKESDWAKSTIDRLIFAKLQAAGVQPAPVADRRTLIRRVFVDLIGLPPTPEELERALNDPSPQWWETLVDRLLSSPHYGERWGRHWLDVARYADSNGKDENFVFHEAWRYRDYVINSFNNDKPYDRFVREQLAGDLLPAQTQAERDEQLTGTGFLVLGPKVLADRDPKKRHMDVVDEQIDTMGRAFLGLTLGCARCHDHKFDPVPTADYYGLAGIFASTHTLHGSAGGNVIISGWMVRPLGADGEAKLQAVQEHKKKLTAVAATITKLKAELAGHEDKASMRVPGKFVGITIDDKEAKLVGNWKKSMFSRPYVGEGYIHDDKTGKGEKSATFTPNLPLPGEYEVFISYTAVKGRSTKTPVTVQGAEGEKTIIVNQEEAPKLDGLFRSIGKFKFKAGITGTVTISNKDTDGYVIVDAVRFVPLGALERDVEMAMGVPPEVRQKVVEAREKLKQLELEEKELKAGSPQPPPLVLAVRDEDKPADSKINVRGNPHQLGAAVPRGFLTVATTGPMPTLPPQQSGRLELARWITDPAQPLTARVMANRIWLHLFGQGLVRSPDNFGIQGERPTHPELLDYLAQRFVQENWSVKKLIRSIVLSRTYQLAVTKQQTSDVENRLFGRANRRRVEAEVIRDAILLNSGQLDRSLGGSAVAMMGERALTNDSKGGVLVDSVVRRSIYLPVIRNELTAVLEIFDFADPDVSTGKRDTTTVATQALFLMNSPFVGEQARLAAKRLLALPTDDAGRVEDLYRRALTRLPTAKEKETTLRFLNDYREALTRKGPRGEAAIEPTLDAWAGVCLAMFGCTEFRFVE